MWNWGRGGGAGRLIPATYFPCSTQPQNSHMVLTVDVLSDRKQVTFYYSPGSLIG